MLRKRILCIMLTICLCIACAPCTFAQNTIAASMAPANITENGITVHKSAVQIQPHLFEVTLQVTGERPVTELQAADVILLLDCSENMAAAFGEINVLQAAQNAVQTLLQTFAAGNMQINVGFIVYGNTATVIGALQPLDTMPLFNIMGGGRNLQAALQAAQQLFATSANPIKYCINLTGGAPNIYGESQQTSLVAPEDPHYLPQETIQMMTQEFIQQTNVTQLLTFQFGSEDMTPFSSPESVFGITPATLEQTVQTQAQSMMQSMQAIQIIDVIGNRFEYEENTLSTTDGTASFSKETRTFTLTLDQPIAQGQTVTVTYRLARNDPQLEGAGTVVPLQASTVLRWREVQASGVLVTQTVSFPQPTILYEKATLLIQSSGLPEDQAIAQTTQVACLDCTDSFSFQAPAETIQDSQLQQVIVDGITMSPSIFLETYPQKIPVKPGETVIEYCYSPLPQNENLSYQVEYYVNGTLYPEWTYQAQLPQGELLVREVENHLYDLPYGYSETPKLLLPNKLAYTGQILCVYYEGPDFSASTIEINSSYYLNSNILENTSVRELVYPNSENIPIITLLVGNNNGYEYDPLEITITRVPLIEGYGDQTQTKMPLTGSFIYEDSYRYIIDATFTRSENQPTAGGSIVSVTPIEPTGTLPQT